MPTMVLPLLERPSDHRQVLHTCIASVMDLRDRQVAWWNSKLALASIFHLMGRVLLAEPPPVNWAEALHFGMAAPEKKQ